MAHQFKIVTIFGTRPEVIKLYPVIRQLRSRPDCICITLASGQHREMQAQMIEALNIPVDYDLAVMKEDQSLGRLTARLVTSLTEVLSRIEPDMILVQGDTTTAFVAALAAFYLKVPVGHVEAGLRTQRRYVPFPEELNRRLIATLADIHFAPTPNARMHLLSEGVSKTRVFVTGNTVVDALMIIIEGINGEKFRTSPDLEEIRKKTEGRKVILVTAHRRESFGEGFQNICMALREIASKAPSAAIVYPVHLNPNVTVPVYRMIGDVSNIHLTKHLDYISFVCLMSNTFLVLTDSGGIQEEATALGKPTLIMREVTERPEAVESGVARLVGTRKEEIINHTLELLQDQRLYKTMAESNTVFGDGRASEKIVDLCVDFLRGCLKTDSQ